MYGWYGCYIEDKNKRLLFHLGIGIYPSCMCS